MYEILQTQGIKAKKYSIWLGSDEIVRSLSKVAAVKLLIHLNQESNDRPIPTDLPREPGKSCSKSNSSTTDRSDGTDELRNRDSLRRLDQEFEKQLSDERERDRQFEIEKQETDRRYAELEQGFDEIFDILSKLSSLSEFRLRNYENQTKLRGASVEPQVRLIEPTTVDVEAREILTLHIHGTKTTQYL